MGLKEMFKNGSDFVKTGINNIVERSKDRKESVQEFELLKTKSKHLDGLKPIEVLNLYSSKGREETILSIGLTVNRENAKKINSLIPVDETIIDIKTAKEASTLMDYTFILTDHKLWIVGKNDYLYYDYNLVIDFKVIYSALMNQYISFNNSAFIFDGTLQDVEKFKNILMNRELFEEEKNKKTSHLHGVIPKEQYLNTINSGMTIGTNGEVVFHDSNRSNKVTSFENIKYIQLLMDNSVVITRGKMLNNITASPSSCRKMTIKVSLENEVYCFELLPETLMNTLIKREDSTFSENYEFGKKLLDRVNEQLNK